MYAISENISFMHTHTHIYLPTAYTSTPPTLAEALITVTPSRKSSVWSRTEGSTEQQRSFKWHTSFMMTYQEDFKKAGSWILHSFLPKQLEVARWHITTVMLWYCKTLENCLINSSVRLGEWIFCWIPTAYLHFLPQEYAKSSAETHMAGKAPCCVLCKWTCGIISLAATALCRFNKVGGKWNKGGWNNDYKRELLWALWAVS